MSPMCPCLPPPMVVDRVAAFAYNICIKELMFSYVGSPSNFGRVLIGNFDTISSTDCALTTMLMECVEKELTKSNEDD